jgi:spore germination protein GerM
MARLWALAVMCLLAGGCAPASTHGVHYVSGKDVPFALMSSAPAGTATGIPNGPTTRIYLLRDQRLFPVARQVVGPNIPADAVRSLLDGPTTADTARGVTSAVPPGTHLLSLDVSAGVATVDLSTEFGSLGGDKQTSAVAQIVYTITASPYINSVLFVINDSPIEVPDGTGSLSSAPRSRDDYPDLVPR